VNGNVVLNDVVRQKIKMEPVMWKFVL